MFFCPHVSNPPTEDNFMEVLPSNIASLFINHLYSVQECTVQVRVELKKGLDIFNKTYKSRGLDMTQHHGNNEFKKIRSHLLCSTLHICAADENIGGIESASHTVKEILWCSFH